MGEGQFSARLQVGQEVVISSVDAERAKCVEYTL
jgi:hypothetical protein